MNPNRKFQGSPCKLKVYLFRSVFTLYNLGMNFIESTAWANHWRVFVSHQATPISSTFPFILLQIFIKEFRLSKSYWSVELRWV